jgi:hypothetical protein
MIKLEVSMKQKYVIIVYISNNYKTVLYKLLP